MIRKIEVSGVHTSLDTKTQKYAKDKIGKIDKYLPRHARESAHVVVKLISQKNKAKEVFVCETIIYLPQATITSKVKSGSFMSAIDQVESKLKIQLGKYKGQHGREKLRQRAIRRFLRSRNK